MLQIRPEEQADIPLIHSLLVSAFGNRTKADLVDALRTAGAATLSLVAVEGEQLVGHILFSPVSSEFDLFGKYFLGLVPITVAPERQKQGVGSKLVRRGLEIALANGWDAVFVLGSPTYYARFGFTPVNDWNLTCKYPIETQELLAVTLKPHGLDGCGGVVSFHPLLKEFSV